MTTTQHTDSPTGVEFASRDFNGKLTTVYVGKQVTLYFSYETIVAFAVAGVGTFKCENVWSSTTGKHLGSIYGDTLPRDEFDSRLARLMGKLDTAVRGITKSELLRVTR